MRRVRVRIPSPVSHHCGDTDKHCCFPVNFSASLRFLLMSQGEWRKHNNNNHNHNNNNTCSTSYTVGESCVCSRCCCYALAGRPVVVLPTYPRIVTPPPPPLRDAFFKAAFSSGLETKERIGTECQRPTVLGRNFYLFFFYDPSFYLFILYYIMFVYTQTHVYYVIFSLRIPILRVWYPPGFIIRPELINCY